MLDIRNIEAKDIPVIAKLHLDHMPLSFPPCRPYFNIMKLIYSSFLVNKEGICHVAVLDSTIVGYVCFLKYLKKTYTTAFKSHPVVFCCNVFILLLRFPFFFLEGLLRVIGTFGSPRSGNKPTTSEFDSWEDGYELRPIVVRNDQQGTSIADQLVSCGEKSLRDRGEKRYFLRVKKDNARAIAFYKKMGFTTAADEGVRIIMVKDMK